jgi:hypothetical protein
MYSRKLLILALAALLPGSAGAVTKTLSFPTTASTNIAIVGPHNCSDFTVSGTTFTCVPNAGTPPPGEVICGDGSHHPAGYVCPTPPPTTSCAGFSAVRNLTMNWNSPTRLFTSSVGGMGPNDVVVVTFTTGNTSSPDNNLPAFAAAEWASGPSTRISVMSSAPCDFTGGNLAQYSGGFNNGTSVSIPFAVGTGTNWGYYPKLALNTTYYFNIKNADNPACASSGDCNMAIDLKNRPASSTMSTQKTKKTKKKPVKK